MRDEEPFFSFNINAGNPTGCFSIVATTVIILAMIGFAVYMIEKGIRWEFVGLMVIIGYPIVYRLTGTQATELAPHLRRLAADLVKRLMGPVNPVLTENVDHNKKEEDHQEP